jgi:predicted dehydrogenase
LKRYKTAIIGTGFTGGVHVEALRQVEFVEVAAVADKDTASADVLGSRYGIPNGFFPSTTRIAPAQK